MGNICNNLGQELKLLLKKADEIWVAVALISEYGLKFIQDNLKDGTKQNYLLGIDLPTDPKVLEILNKQQTLQGINVGMYAKKEFYHPKVYILKQKHAISAFVGSANCTEAGLFSNIELTVKITDLSECNQLIKWFEEHKNKAARLSSTFIKDYKITYDKRKQRHDNDEHEASQAKKKLIKDYEMTLSRKKDLVRMLKLARNTEEYEEIKKERKREVEKIRKSLDYPDFRNIDIEAFFKLHALGHLIEIPKPTLHAEIDRFRKLLKVLADDSIDVSVKIDRALKGDLYIRGVGEALLTKVLTIHNPQKYFVKNLKSDTALALYGIELPKRISAGEKYKATNKFLLELLKETGIEDFAILDMYLYNEAENKS